MTILLAVLVGVSFGAVTYLLVVRPSRTLYSSMGASHAEPKFRHYSRGWFQVWAEKFNRSGAQASQSWVPGTVMLVVPAFLGLAAALLSGLILAGPLVGLLAIALPWMFLRNQGDKRAKALDAQLVPFLDAVGKGLEGGTIIQAIREATERVDPPLSHEMEQVLVEVDSGKPLSEALQEVAQRSSSRGLLLTCSTLDLALTTGAPTLRTNLSEITSSLVAMQGLERRVKARTVISRIGGHMGIVIVGVLTAGSVLVATEAWLTPWGLAALAVILGSMVGLRVAFNGIFKRTLEVSP